MVKRNRLFRWCTCQLCQCELPGELVDTGCQSIHQQRCNRKWHALDCNWRLRRHVFADTNTDSDSDSDANANANADTNADTDTDSNADANTNNFDRFGIERL